MRRLYKFALDKSGTTAIEYALIAGGIAIAIVAVVRGIGTALIVPFTTVYNALS